VSLADEYTDGDSRPADDGRVLDLSAARVKAKKLAARVVALEADLVAVRAVLAEREAELHDAREQHADDMRALNELRERLRHVAGA